MVLGLHRGGFLPARATGRPGRRPVPGQQAQPTVAVRSHSNGTMRDGLRISPEPDVMSASGSGAVGMRIASVFGSVALVALLTDGRPSRPTRRPPCPQGPVAAPAYDWNGFYFGGHVGYGQGRTDATVTDPAATLGRQHVRRQHRRRPARLQHGAAVAPAARARDRPHLRQLPRLRTPSSPRSRPRAATSREQIRLHRHRAGAPRLCERSRGWSMRTGGFAFAGTRVLNTPPNIDEEKKLNIRSGWSLGAGFEYALVAALERAGRVSLQPVHRRRRPVPVRHALFVDLQFPGAAGRPQPQARRRQQHRGRRQGRHRVGPLGAARARPPTSSRAIRRSARPTRARTACRPPRRRARPGR